MIYITTHTTWVLNSKRQKPRGTLIMNIDGKSVNPNIFIKAINQTVMKSTQAQKKILFHVWRICKGEKKRPQQRSPLFAACSD